MKSLSVIATNSCGWPILTKIPNGKILCIYFNAPSHGLVEGDLVCSISDRNGRNWRKISVVAPRPKGGNRMHLAVGTTHSGDIICFSSGYLLKDGKFSAFSAQWLSRSKDGGKKWVVDEKPVTPRGIINTIPFGRIIKLGDKNLAYSSYRAQGKGSPSESWMIVSEDDGFTWSKKYKFGENDSNEATLCQLNDGLVAATRTHIDHHVKYCECSGLGRKWIDKGPLTLPMQHPADLIAINESCLLITYGIRNRGLMAIGARLSIDKGKTWRPPWVIHQFGNKATDIGYPSTVLLGKNGELLTAFYTDFEPSIRKNPSKYRVFGMHWNLKDWMPDNLHKLMFEN